MKIVLGFILACWSLVAYSETELDYLLGTYLSKTTNISQNTDGEEGTIWQTEGSFSFESTDIKDWEVQVSASASYLDYSLSFLENEDRINFSAVTRYEPSNTNFYLNILENLSQVPANRFQTTGVNNQRDSNVFAVSPNYYFRLSPSTKVEFHYQFADYKIESDILTSLLQDNDRVERQSSISVSNQVNSNSEFSLIAQNKDVDFENELGSVGRDFTQKDFLLRWSTSNLTSNFSLSAGRFKVDDVEGQTAEDNQFRLFFRRQLNRTQSIDIQATRGVAQLFTINTATGTITINQQNNAVTRAQLSRGGGAQYLFTDGVLTANIGFFENELSGLFERSEEVRKTYNLRITHSLSRLLNTTLPRSLTFSSSHTKNEFDVQFSNVLENNIEVNEITYSHSTSRNWSFTITYQDRRANRLALDSTVTEQDSRSLLFGIIYQGETRY